MLESVIDHDGSFARIADWLLECLDSQPPHEGGHLVLYVWYHVNDRSFFSSPERSGELGRALFGSYQREIAWDGKGFGDLRFDLTKDHEQLLLTLRELDDRTNQTAKREPTVIEFYWHESELKILPGAIGLARRWVKPLAETTDVVAVLSVESNTSAAIARHAHLQQLEIRIPEPCVYLPEGVTSITIGSVAGSDIWVPELGAPVKFEYDSSDDEWRWAAPTAPWFPSGCKTGNLSLDLEVRSDERSIVVKGERLSVPSTLADIRDKNKIPNFVVEIVGCLLPTPNEQSDWAGNIVGIQPSLAALASSAIELPGGSWLYCDRDSSAAYLLRVGERLPGRLLTRDGAVQELRSRSAHGPQLQGKWTEFTKGMLPYFRGELTLLPPLTSRLAADAICGDLPTEIFPEYVDKCIGRPPCRLESGDGRSYTLAFNPSAKHPVFLLSKTNSKITRYDPSSSRVIDLGSGAEFILGATHYRLRQLAEA